MPTGSFPVVANSDDMTEGFTLTFGHLRIYSGEAPEYRTRTIARAPVGGTSAPPRGARIVDAYVTIFPANTTTDRDLHANVTMQDVGNAPAPAYLENLSLRPRVLPATQVRRSAGVMGTSHRIDLTAQVQVVVDRADWSPGNYMAWLLDGADVLGAQRFHATIAPEKPMVLTVQWEPAATTKAATLRYTTEPDALGRTASEAVRVTYPVTVTEPEPEPDPGGGGGGGATIYASGDTNLPGADADKITRPGVFFLASMENGNTDKWGLHTSNRSDNFSFPLRSGSGRVLRARNPGNLSYPDARWGGALAPRLDRMSPVQAPQDDLFMSYRVLFPLDYYWGGHGKLPGIAGVVPGFSNLSSGGTFYDYSFTCRLLFQEDKGASTYFYVRKRGTQDIVSNNSSRGWSSRLITPGGQQSNLFVPGQEHLIVMRCKMNSQPGVNDGVIQVWIDGVLVHSRSDYGFRTAAYPQLRGNIGLLEWFYGGGAEDMPNYNGTTTKGADRPVTIDFDRVLLGASYADVATT